VKLSAWRIVQARHAAHAFSGAGARLYGGRRNSPGVAMIYTAQSRALAALEILVHLEAPLLLASYELFEVRFDERTVNTLAAADLPADWRDDPIPVSTQRLGDKWAQSAASPVLRVPSALIPQESNYLLNPLHPAFKSVEIREPAAFAFDRRLKSA
jgi:RES domain-containing protein